MDDSQLELLNLIKENSLNRNEIVSQYSSKGISAYSVLSVIDSLIASGDIKYEKIPFDVYTSLEITKKGKNAIKKEVKRRTKESSNQHTVRAIAISVVSALIGAALIYICKTYIPVSKLLSAFFALLQ